MIKTKKQMFIVISVFTLILLLGTTTYAFFNYTRTGTANVIKVGRISFITRQTDTINLTNLFPIDPTETGIMNDDTKVGTLTVEIEGDTDYADGIEYLVSAVDANIYTNQGQIVPISLDVTVDSLGTENANYFTTRESKNANIYKKLVGDTLVGDQMLLVGYITKNNPSGTKAGVDGSITIKAYLDKNKILISDTYDGTESDNMGTPNSMAEGKTVITTSEWNALQQNGISFKVKVEANEGIWVNPSLEEIMKRDNIGIDTENGVDFSKTSDEDGLNGEGTKGVYMLSSSQNDTNPIYYYRGAVDDNNVIFGNQCWKAVRTTDTGGVKLIYNGTLSTNKAPLSQSDYGIPVTNNGFTFDTSDNSWNAIMTTNLTSSDAYEISFNVSAGDEYVLQISGVPTAIGGVIVGVYNGSSYVNGTSGVYGTPFQLSHSFGTLTASDTIKVKYYTSSGNSTSENPSTIKVQMIKPDVTLGIGCANSGTAAQITSNVGGTLQSQFAFNTNYNSPAYVGYMYGEAYTYNEEEAFYGSYFGNSFTWDGTNYKLVDAITSKNNTHHYTCNLNTPDGTCTTLRYYYYLNYYVNLTGGDGIEDVIKKMQTNTNDSNAKNVIDTWYVSNLINYTKQIEDTVWCNDRSFGDNDNNGWIANGGDLSEYLKYGAYQRSAYASNTSTVKNQPSLACINKNDRFTVNNGKGNKNLDYPVAMLTEDESVLAGGSGWDSSTYYLNSEYTSYWSLSPYRFDSDDARVFVIIDSIGNTYVSSTTNGLRPAISIKPGQLITKGTGTVSDPYVIE